MLILRTCRAAVLAAVTLALLTGACNDSDSPTEPPSDSISIESIAPASSTILRRGTQVTITVTARYTLSSASEGRISLVIQDQSNQNIAPLPQPMALVPRGQGTVTLNNTLTIPAGATSVRVFVPLSPQGATQTSTVATATYTVTS
jgi:hypothetical protein